MRKAWTWRDTHCEEMTTALSNKLRSGHRRTTEEEIDQVIPKEEIWGRKLGQHDWSTPGGRWSWRLKTELDGKV